MADDASRVKTITNNIEETYKSLKKAASSIAGLLRVGRATCDEVRAYNLWALAIYNSQRGVLATMRTHGQTGIPDLPPAPTLFVWRGVQGADAWKIDCAGQPSSLRGAMQQALRGQNEGTQYLSTNEIAISTQDQFVYNPESSPSFATLERVQQERAAQAGLGFPVALTIVVAGFSILAIAAIVVAIMDYLKTNAIQEANTEQMRLQAAAFAHFEDARNSCYDGCLKTGKSAEHCVGICKDLIDKPNFKSPGQDTKWGLLQWTGFTVIAGAVSLVGYKIYQRRQAGKPMFELPSFDDASEDAV